MLKNDQMSIITVCYFNLKICGNLKNNERPFVAAHIEHMICMSAGFIGGPIYTKLSTVSLIP